MKPKSTGHTKERKKCGALYNKMKMYEERMKKHMAKAKQAEAKMKKYKSKHKRHCYTKKK